MFVLNPVSWFLLWLWLWLWLLLQLLLLLLLLLLIFLCLYLLVSTSLCLLSSIVINLFVALDFSLPSFAFCRTLLCLSMLFFAPRVIVCLS